MIEGTLDVVVGRTLHGWAWDDSRPDDPVVVDFYDQDTRALLQSVTAGLLRADLREAGKGNGRHGFSVNLPAVRRRLAVSARVSGTDFILSRSPLHVEIGDGDNRESRLQGRFCPMPFEKLVLQSDGARLCCPSYLPVVVGDPNTQTLDEIWSSEMAIEVRRSIIDGDFKYCLDLCPAIGQGTLPMAAAVAPEIYGPAVEARSAPLAWRPRELALLHDRTCNLSCPSCRTSILAATPREREVFQGILERVIRPALGTLKVLELGGGEVLASHHLRSVLASVDHEENPDLRVAIMTNGTLFDRDAWNDLQNVHGIVHLIYVSLDAATKETFEELRRGGIWERTIENVEFISSLRRDGEIEELGILFVVQAGNFREMKDFVRLGKRLGCDRILFHELVNFGTWPEQGFEERSVVSPSHPQYRELLAELQDPVFDEPGVDLTNLRSLRIAHLARCHGP
jgi:sulfatase maturation enzyme AslB (radical SAM superfamily)